MTKSRAQEMAEKHSQLYYYDEKGNQVSAGPNPIKEASFLAGFRACIAEAEKKAWRTMDGLDVVKLSDLKKLLEEG